MVVGWALAPGAPVRRMSAQNSDVRMMDRDRCMVPPLKRANPGSHRGARVHITSGGGARQQEGPGTWRLTGTRRRSYGQPAKKAWRKSKKSWEFVAPSALKSASPPKNALTKSKKSCEL